MTDINIRSMRASLMGRWSNSWSISELKAKPNYKRGMVFCFAILSAVKCECVGTPPQNLR